MQLPLQITFRGMEPSVAIEARIRERAQRLERFHDHIMACRVMVEAPHRHHHNGKIFHVRIDLTVPRHELIVNREPPEHHAYEDVYVAIRDAFDAAQRQLESTLRKQRGFVKSHNGAAVARITRISYEDGFGFLSTAEGREIYFHQNSVLGVGFPELKVGTEVRYAEELGDKGPQASTVQPL